MTTRQRLFVKGKIPETSLIALHGGEEAVELNG